MASLTPREQATLHRILDRLAAYHAEASVHFDRTAWHEELVVTHTHRPLHLETLAIAEKVPFLHELFTIHYAFRAAPPTEP
jgi:hypothetical protein